MRIFINSKLINTFGSKIDTTISNLVVTLCLNLRFVYSELTEKQPIKKRYGRA